MRSIVVVFLLVLQVLQVLAQRPAQPVVDSVSVNQQTGGVWISWSPEPGDSIDGFYLFRFIHEGENVFDSTFQKIDTLAAAITSYSDNTPHYQAEVLPGKHSERYRVAAFNSAGQSLMSPVHATVHLQPVAFDSCRAAAQLTWTRYIGWENTKTEYLIYAKKNGEAHFKKIGRNAPSPEGDTTFTHQFLNARTSYDYYIKARHTELHYTSSSNIKDIYTKMPHQPNRMQADFASVNQDGTIDVQFRIDPAASVSHYTLEHTNDSSGTWEKLKDFPNPSDPLRYQVKLTPFKQHFFRLSVVNSCNIPYNQSGIIYNTVLKANPASGNPNRVNLSWIPQATGPDSLVRYTLFKQQANGNFQQIHQTAKTRYTWEGNGAATSKERCFYVVATTSANDFEVRSNTACASQDAIIGMPNAFNPASDISANRTFKPTLSFVDNYRFQIFNRWGDLIFSTRQPSEGWKGQINGKSEAPEGVYIYRIYYTKNGKERSVNGTVTLIR